MSDYGFKAYNGNNRILIDGSFSNFTYYTSDSDAVGTETVTLIPFGGTTSSPKAFIKPSTVYTSVAGFRKTGSEYDGIRIGSASSHTAYWAVFTETNPTSADLIGYGMSVLNADGDVVFNSNDTDLVQVVDNYVYNNSFNDITDYVDVTVEDTTNYFQLTGGAYGFSLATGGTRLDYTLGLKYTSATNIRIGYYIYRHTTWAGGVSLTFASQSISPQTLVEIKPPYSL